MAWIFTSDGNYVNFNGGGNLWRLHKDSNCISWHWDESGDLFFDVYDQEYTVKAGNIADVVIDGVPLSAASGFPTAIKAAFTGLSSGGSSYLVYTALLTQTGTNAPVATVLENTLGGTVVWTRIGVGEYHATLAGAFTENKTYFPPFDKIGAGVIIPIQVVAGVITGGFTMLWNNVNSIILLVVDGDMSPAELDGYFGDTSPLSLPEIRVYP